MVKEKDGESVQQNIVWDLDYIVCMRSNAANLNNGNRGGN